MQKVVIKNSFNALAIIFFSIIFLACGGGGGGDGTEPVIPTNPPTANAGADLSVEVNETVILNGGGSSGDAGTTLTYSWSMISRPSGSGATLDDTSIVNPRFLVDTAGEYQVQLIVNDGTRSSSSDTVIISTQNAAPVANAGADLAIELNDLVTLDASQSTDVDGDQLSYSWVLTNVPTESTAVLENATSIFPSFTADKTGSYSAELTVNDGIVASSVDQVNIIIGNVAPIANAGISQVVLAGDLVEIDASGSTDVNGDPLTYQWTIISKPGTSNAVLSDSTAITPTFTLDVDGQYQLQLVVNDGALGSEPSSVIISTDNIAPLANAGLDQNIIAGNEFSLNANASTDANGDSINYQWQIISRPEGSTIELDDSLSITTSATADVAGNYIVQLVVRDNELSSSPDVVLISTENVRPIALIESDITSLINDSITFDGTNSNDVNGDELVYSWSIISQPENSNLIISDPGLSSIALVPSIAGLYITQLIVSDSRFSSIPITQKLEVSEFINNSPTLSAINDQQTEIDASYSLTLDANDVDGDVISYSLENEPLGMQVNFQGIISWKAVIDGVYSVTVNVDDGRGGSDSETFIITATGQTANSPILDEVGDQIAVLGQTMSVQLSASDPENLAIQFLATPMPLLPNMNLISESGLFTFAPDLSQVGIHEITFIATNGRFQDSETITIDVPAAGVTTKLSGQVLTLNDVPLPGVVLEMDGIEATSDDEGNFVINNIISSGMVRLLVDGSSVDSSLGAFATVPEIINIIAGADNQLTPAIYLLPLDVDSADPVDPNQTSIITSSRFTDGLSISEPVTMTIPPNSAIDDATGEFFVGDIHISRVTDSSLGPRPLPEDYDFSVYIAIQPFGVTYPEPVPISFPNVEDFPPGSRMDFFALNHETGEMEKIGEGLVSSDGKTIDSIGGIVKSNSWHGTVPQEVDANSTKEEKVSESKNGDKDCSGCAIDKETGNLIEWHTLPSYQSLQQSRSITLQYNSNLANPKPIMPLESGFGNAAPPPDSMSMKINIDGVDLGTEYFSEVNVVPSEIRTQFKTTRPALQFDAKNIETGIHNYQLKLNCYFPISRRQTTVEGQIIIRNEQNSPIGAGWTLAGVQKAYEYSTGDVLITSGSSSSVVFILEEDETYTAPGGEFSRLTKDANGGLERKLKDGTIIRFDIDGLMFEHEDRNNNITQYIYDSELRLVQITDPVGKAFILEYGAGKLNAITDPLNRVTRFEHDSEGNLITVIEPNLDKRQFEYETSSHLMIAQLDQLNNRKEYSFDFADKIKQATQPDGSIVTFDIGDVKGLLDPALHEASKENPAPAPLLLEEVNNATTDFNGNVTTAVVNKRNASLSSTDSVGRTYLNERDEDSNSTQVTRPNTSTITNTFDDKGNVLTSTENFNSAEYQLTYDEYSLATKMTNANDHSVTLNRDINGNLLSVVNELGHTTSYLHDSRGLVTQLTTPNLLQINYTYNDDGLVTQILETPPATSGLPTRTSLFEYDLAGQATKVTTADDITMTLTYDQKSRVTQVEDNLGQQIKYTYDGFNNVISTESNNADGSLSLKIQKTFDNRNRVKDVSAPHTGIIDSRSQIILDNNSNITQTIDPNGATSTSSYDAEDRLTQTIHRLNGTVNYSYDTNNQLTQVIASNGAVTNYTYDDLGRRLSEVSPDRGTITYQYDKANNLTSSTDARGIVTNFIYDELERMTSQTFSNTIGGKIEDIQASYDNCTFGIGKLCSRTDESGVYEFSYDPFGNLTAESRTSLGVTYITSYSYDKGNNLTQVVYPTGRVVNYSRDGVKRISAVTTTVNGVSQNIISNVQYRADNKMTQCTFGNGLVDDRNYDLQGRITSQNLGSIDNRTYSYDFNGNILNRFTTPQNSTYQYDALDRIISDKEDDEDAFNYVYDLNNNRQSKIKGDIFDENQSFSLFTNRLTDQSTVNTNGIVGETETEKQYVYNNANRYYQLLIEQQIKAEYIYNAIGQRTQKTIYNQDDTQTITLYHYNMFGDLIAETDEVGLTKKDYIWSEQLNPIAQIDVFAEDDSVIYLHTDHLMTARIGTDENQSIIWQWESDAFGIMSKEVNLSAVNFRFPGQYFDDESKQYYNWSRFYNAETGSYNSSDSIGLLGGGNTYSYSGANPNTKFDANGKIPLILVIPLISGTISGVSEGFTNYQKCGELKRALWRGVHGFIVGASSSAITIGITYLTKNPAFGDAVGAGIGEIISQSLKGEKINGFKAVISSVLSRIPGLSLNKMKGRPPSFLKARNYLNGVGESTSKIIRETIWSGVAGSYLGHVAGYAEKQVLEYVEPYRAPMREKFLKK